MQISIRLVSGEPHNLTLRREKESPNSNITWVSDSNGPELAITTDPSGAVLAIHASNEISSSRSELIDAFMLEIAELRLQESAGIEATETGDGLGEPEPFPYDPEFIRVDTKPFNISLVFEMIKEGDIDLSPDFQRHFVWTDVGARSRLIESIMLRIPLPVFYLAQDNEGRLQVVDGLQRLTVIEQFLSGNLKLRDLEYLTEEEGKIFSHEDPSKCISQRFRKRILQTQLLMNIIDPQTPADVKFDIFKRINQGGRPLNAQEIRNCMASPSTRELLHTLSESAEFLRATCNSVGTVRMQDQELALRFIAFLLAEEGIMHSYPGNMERFLDQAVDLLNREVDHHSFINTSFKRSMNNSLHLFGDYAFRKCQPEDLEEGARRKLMNNSLFTTWSVALARLPESDVAQVRKGSFAELLAHELENDPEYYDSVSFGTNDRRRLAYAFEKARELLAEKGL